MKIGRRLFVGFGAVLLLLLVTAGFGLWKMSAIADNTERIVKHYYAQDTLANDMGTQVHVVSRVLRTVIILTDDAAMARERLKITQAREAYDEAEKKLEATLHSDKSKELFHKVREVRSRVRPINDRILDLGLNNKNQEASELLVKEGIAGVQAWLDIVDELTAYFGEQMQVRYQEAEAAYHTAQMVVIILSLLALAAGLTLALFITRSITRPVAAFGLALHQVAQGDLRQEALVETQDELGQMGMALNGTIQRLREAFINIQESSFSIAQASGEISAGNTDLSGRTEEQAASLEETASSLEEFTSTVNQTADNARSATTAAAQAQAVAQEGSESVTRLVSAMDEINQASARIAEIITVVDEIAFQTNLLALNAAVEAARAGEQGRGFAVVAAEVRNLAKRSADAAKEIKALIKDSVSKAQEGQKVAARTGQTMLDVVTNVQKVTGIIGDIASATHEQSSGINEINKAVTQMDEVTQQNAALVEEAAAAAESLDEQAQALSEVVANWKTGQDARAVRRPGAAPQRRPLAKAKAETRRPGLRSVSRGEIGNSRPQVAPPKGEDGDLWDSF